MCVHWDLDTLQQILLGLARMFQQVKSQQTGLPGFMTQGFHEKCYSVWTRQFLDDGNEEKMKKLEKLLLMKVCMLLRKFYDQMREYIKSDSTISC